MATTLEDFKAYCERFHLSLVVAPEEPLDDPEEWPDTEAVGFHDDPVFLAPACFLSRSLEFSAVTTFADGRKHMEDQVRNFSDFDVRVARVEGVPLHAV